MRDELSFRRDALPALTTSYSVSGKEERMKHLKGPTMSITLLPGVSIGMFFAGAIGLWGLSIINDTILSDPSLMEEAGLATAFVLVATQVIALLGFFAMIVFALVALAQCLGARDRVKSFQRVFGVEFPGSEQERGILQLHVDGVLRKLAQEHQGACEAEAQLLAHRKHAKPHAGTPEDPAVQIAGLRMMKGQIQQRGEEFRFARYLAQQGGFEVKEGSKAYVQMQSA